MFGTMQVSDLNRNKKSKAPVNTLGVNNQINSSKNEFTEIKEMDVSNVNAT